MIFAATMIKLKSFVSPRSLFNYLAANFIQIDTVFGLDCPVCAMSLKRMWCEYTCNPNKAKFVAGLGYQNDTDPLVGLETLTQFTLDPDYACVLFQSCQKVSLIA